MKKLMAIIFLITSMQSFAGIECSGNGITVQVTDSPLHVSISRNGTTIADTSDVSDISAFEIHYIGNFGRSSFDLIINDNNQGVLNFDNYSLSTIKLNCR